MKNLHRALVSLGVLASFVWLERKRPLRPAAEPQLRRLARNLSLAALSALAIHAIETPIVLPVARWVGRYGFGLLKLRKLPRWMEIVAAVMLMDYTLFLWHIFVHKNQFLWRFHAVHHADLDLDASTALRFHFGEMALSVPYRALQIMIIGADDQAFAIWQKFLALAILFHHSNLRLPISAERYLSWFIATPRMHGIHHSQDFRQQWTNWSSGLALWDRLYRTYVFDVPQERLAIGVKELAAAEQVTLAKLIEMPFRFSAACAPE